VLLVLLVRAISICHTGRAVPTNTYETRVHWTGSTGLGWDRYDRAHSVSSPPAQQEVRVTTGEEKGDPALLNPEQLLLMAASSCQMLWFLHLAAKARIDVVGYEDDATAVMPVDEQPARVTEIALRPRILVSGDASEQRVRKLMDTAHEHCYVANSLNCAMTIDPQVVLHA
jgi:organic hydroperoxide reductase OsmC/OhrA